MIRAAAAAMVVWLAAWLVCCARSSPPVRVARPDPGWAIDPAFPGPDRPPVGRSLFDDLTGGRVPFPFDRLAGEIMARAGVERVLIPLSRSLQRNAAAPDFFSYPRALIAVDGEDRKGQLALRNRLFLGYQEKAAIIEIISYNEEAGRFEFQVIKDYREGGVAAVSYASRTVCTVCHQNQGPIFSRPLWDETNGSGAMGAMLTGSKREFYGFQAAQTADISFRFDTAVHAANQAGAVQAVWRAAPSYQVRAGWFLSALGYRLGGSRRVEGSDPAAWRDALREAWRARWPGGLKIQNPEIPNRNPLAELSRAAVAKADLPRFLAARQANIPVAFEPAVRRAPLEYWHADDADAADRLIGGLAGFLADSDMQRLERRLAEVPAPAREYRSPCAATGIRGRMILDCHGGAFSLRGVGGTIRSLAIAGATAIADVPLAGGQFPGTLEIQTRGPDGNLFESVAIDGRGVGILTVRDQMTGVRRVVASLAESSDAFSARPFRRQAVMQAIFERLGNGEARLP